MKNGKIKIILFLVIVFSLVGIMLRIINAKKQKENLISKKGKIEVVNFWSIFCGPCLKELPSLNIVYHRYKNFENFTMVAIALNSNNEINQFLSGDTSTIWGKRRKYLESQIDFKVIPYYNHDSVLDSTRQLVIPNKKNYSLLEIITSKYQLEGIPTTIIFFNGKECKRLLGFSGNEEEYQTTICAVVDSLLN
ncbi:MAG: TlpA family protein disulfide reductase [Agriterribacter sp.]